jgi:hypothetical protein
MKENDDKKQIIYTNVTLISNMLPMRWAVNRKCYRKQVEEQNVHRFRIK